MAFVIRLRSPSGQFRVLVNQSDTIQSLSEKITNLVGRAILSTEPNNGGNVVNLEKLDSNLQVSSLGLQNGVLLYSNNKASSNKVPEEKKAQKTPATSRSFIKQDPLDDYLLKQPGTIKRERNPQFCKHGDQGMCEYCMPLQPYDVGYLEENKIKHMSFHAYLRQLVDKGKIPSPHSPQFIAPLDIPNYSVITPCPAGTHGAYPLGICSKCQPSAITLQTQNFRMVDHVEFESPSIIDNFLSYWRSSGVQRAGYLYGRYEPYDKVPLGVKAVVSCIYEVAQNASHDFIQLDMNESSQQFQFVNNIAKDLGLVRLGVIYTDLLDDGTGKGAVICKRHADSYFLSSSEILFSAYMQSNSPVKTIYSPTGEFGSRFVTLVVTGNQENQIDFFPYQVSNSGISMTRDKIIEASADPALMRVCTSTPVKYIPDVFFKYKNKYNLMIQEAAKPTFPVEYLLITASHGFPSAPNPFFTQDSGDFIENRVGMGSRTLQKLNQIVNSSPLLQTVSNFHILLFLCESGILDKSVLTQICTAVKDKNESGLDFLSTNEQWATFKMILSESEYSSQVPSRSGYTSQNQNQESTTTPWACPHCTFHNISGSSCEMCGLPRD